MMRSCSFIVLLKVKLNPTDMDLIQSVIGTLYKVTAATESFIMTTGPAVIPYYSLIVLISET
jgi:hypothetical protein